LVVAVSETQAQRKMNYDAECFKCEDMAGMGTPEYLAVEINSLSMKAWVKKRFPKEMKDVEE